MDGWINRQTDKIVTYISFCCTNEMKTRIQILESVHTNLIFLAYFVRTLWNHHQSLGETMIGMTFVQ